MLPLKKRRRRRFEQGMVSTLKSEHLEHGYRRSPKVASQVGLHSKFQTRQDYIARLSFPKQNKMKHTHTHKFKALHFSS